MRKDVKLGLAVGGILFGAVMVYVLFFANGAKTSSEQARNAGKSTDAGSQTTGQDGSPPSVHPLTSLLSGNEASQTQPTDSSLNGSARRWDSNVSISGPATQPAAPADSPNSLDNAITSVRSGSFNWREALERGANDAASRTLTPDNSLATDHTSHPVPPTMNGIPTTRPSTATRTYIVKQGDTLWSIAKAEYGSPTYYPHLARANPKVGSRLLTGMKLNLPAKDDVVPESAKAVLATPKVVDGTRQYRVQTGDNLTNICKKLYGKTDLVTKLYELNKDLIGPNRSALKPNMVLQLPEAPASSTTVNGSSSAGGNINILAGATH